MEEGSYLKDEKNPEPEVFTIKEDQKKEPFCTCRA